MCSFVVGTTAVVGALVGAVVTLAVVALVVGRVVLVAADVGRVVVSRGTEVDVRCVVAGALRAGAPLDV